MAYSDRDGHGFRARLARSLSIYAQYQLAGLGMSGMSILSMLLADRFMLTREPNLALFYVAVLAVPLGVWGLVKAVRFYAAARPETLGAHLQPR